MNGQCENVEPLIIEYALGELGPSDGERVEAHVESCSRCSGALEEVRRIVSLLSEQEVVEPSAAVCHSVKEAVYERFSRPGTPFSVITSAAESFFRRPVLAGASALLLIAAVTLLVVVPSLQQPQMPTRGKTKQAELGVTIFYPSEVGRYFSETEQLLRTLEGPNAGETLVSRDWMKWVAPAKALKGKEGFEAYRPLFEDLEKVYDAISQCDGRFGQEQTARIQNLIAELDLIERTKEAIRSHR